MGVPGESGRERILCESGNESRREIKLGESGCERSSGYSVREKA